MENIFDDALLKGRGNADLILENVGFDDTADVLEKGKKASIGEIREWNGKKVQKTAEGWRPVKGSKSSKEEGGEESTFHKQMFDMLVNEYKQNNKMLVDALIGDDEGFFTRLAKDYTSFMMRRYGVEHKYGSADAKAIEGAINKHAMNAIRKFKASIKLGLIS